jgi:hypothetical protein
MIRSQATFRQAVQLVQNGDLGKITRGEVGLLSGHKDFGKTANDLPDGPVADGVDDEMWTGPANARTPRSCDGIHDHNRISRQ